MIMRRSQTLIFTLTVILVSTEIVDHQSDTVRRKGKWPVPVLRS